MTFAVMAFSLLGLVGLTIEAGSWIMTRSAVQAAADGASIAAVLASNEGVDPIHAASDSLGRNGFVADGANVTVAISVTPTAGTVLATAETTITTRTVPLLASLFVGESAFNIAARSGAGLQLAGSACVLSTASDLLINAPQLGRNCAYASDTDGAGSITVNAANVDVYAFVTSGGCQGCTASSRGLTRPVSAFQPPVVDPFAQAIQQARQASLPASASALRCVPAASAPASELVPATGIPGDPTYTTGAPYWAYCDTDVIVAAGTNAVLGPGIYYFWNASLTVQNGAAVACQTSPGVACDPTNLIAGTGVTFVFTGPGGGGAPTSSGPACDISGGITPGKVNVTGLAPSGPALKICPTGNVRLSPPSNADVSPENFDPALHGVLVWRDGRLAAGVLSNPVADIQATSPYSSVSGGPPPFTVLNGLLYFPNAFVNFGANNAVYGGSAPQVACTTLVAGGVNLVNDRSIFQDCASRGLTTPRVLTVRVRY